MNGPIPQSLLTAFAAITVFTVMFSVGLVIVPRELRWIWQRPGPMLRGVFAVLVAVPVLAVLVTRAFALPRPAAIGIVLMAISPGAPVALRRSLDAGGHHAFAPSLQISVAILAVVSMPLSIAILNRLYVGNASITVGSLVRQVLGAQLVPLALGMATSRALPALAGRLEPRLTRVGTALLLVLAVLALLDAWSVTIHAGLRAATAIVLTTVGALAMGHLLGGPEPGTRTAVAVSSAMRNPGLALLVAALNNASPAIQGAVLAYLVISFFTVLPYLGWRRRARLVSLG